MDADYRRDKPGKSPMGMDLVPVYAQETRAEDDAGAVEISPEVVNNLGVRTARVELRALQTRISTVGYVQYDQDRLVHVHPRVEGWIEKLYVKAAGDPVTEGEPLYELYSPQHSGVVDNLNIREGFYVKPGTTLMSIGALDDVWVEAEVFARQAALVQVGQPVTMTLEYAPGRKWQGSVDYVYPSLDEQTRTLRVRLRFANSDLTLKPNMFAQVVIDVAQQGDVLQVPREAVIRTGDQDRVVMALGEGRFKSVAVALGRSDEQAVEILQGVELGDTVVVSAQFLLDSESSKSSDFKRMHSADGDTMDMGGHAHHRGADHD
jgi:Cu(I)/Ag(I) efflux system membrane fusion protein